MFGDMIDYYRFIDNAVSSDWRRLIHADEHNKHIHDRVEPDPHTLLDAVTVK